MRGIDIHCLAAALLSMRMPAWQTPLQVGDKFVLNCLGEGEYNATMKHFLQVGRLSAHPGQAFLRLHACVSAAARLRG